MPLQGSLLPVRTYAAARWDLRFRALWQGSPIGEHRVAFRMVGDRLVVDTHIDIAVSDGGIGEATVAGHYDFLPFPLPFPLPLPVVLVVLPFPAVVAPLSVEVPLPVVEVPLPVPEVVVLPELLHPAVVVLVEPVVPVALHPLVAPPALVVLPEELPSPVPVAVPVELLELVVPLLEPVEAVVVVSEVPEPVLAPLDPMVASPLTVTPAVPAGAALSPEGAGEVVPLAVAEPEELLPVLGGVPPEVLAGAVGVNAPLPVPPPPLAGLVPTPPELLRDWEVLANVRPSDPPSRPTARTMASATRLAIRAYSSVVAPPSAASQPRKARAGAPGSGQRFTCMRPIVPPSGERVVKTRSPRWFRGFPCPGGKTSVGSRPPAQA
jgi:hypothetical protein